MNNYESMANTLGFHHKKNPDYANATESEALGGIFDDLMSKGQQVITKTQSAVVQSGKKNILEVMNDPEVRATTSAFISDQIAQKKPQLMLAGAFLGGYIIMSVLNLTKGITGR